MNKKLSHQEFIERLENANPGYTSEYEFLTEYKSNKEKIKIKHKSCGSEFISIPMRVMRGQGCPICNSKKLKTTDDFISEVKTLVGNEYTILSEYKNCKEKIRIRHNECGTEFEMAPDDFLQGQRCPKCGRLLAGKKSRKTNDEFVEKIKELVGDEYTVLSDYITNKEHVLFKHNKCGNEFKMTPVNFYRGHRCPNCYKSVKKTTDEIRDEIKSLVGDEYTLLSEYDGLTKKIKLRHETCKNEYLILPQNFIKKGNRCPFCYGNVKLSTDDFKKRVYDLVKDEYQVLSEYTGMNKKIKMKHTVCGHEFEMRPGDFLYGEERCTACAYKSSKKEKEVLDFVKSVYIGEVKENVKFYYDETNKRKYHEADILIEDKKLIIEFDGIFWHSTMNRKDSRYHLNKSEYFFEQGYRTIHIFEDEWENKKDIVKTKILHILGLNKSKVVYARKCSVKKISSPTSAEFLDKYHIQGNVSALIKYGLYFGDELVAVMTFSKPRIAMGQKNTESGVVELIRYASSGSVVGGFSKMISYAIKDNPEFKQIITYADLRYSPFSNSVYEKNGFKKVGQTEPNYFYYNGLQKNHRFKFRKQNLKKMFPNIYKENLTEFDIMNQTNYTRIYDCGNLKFVLDIKK